MMPETGETMAEAGEMIAETGETYAPAPEVLDARLRSEKKNQRTLKAALTRAGKAINHLIQAERPQEEVSQSLLLYKQTYKTLVLKHEEYTSMTKRYCRRTLA